MPTATANGTLGSVLEESLLVLSDKEREVIVKRFALDGDPRATLEKIGQKFAVTRERVRQIENIALQKLRRTLSSSHLKTINETATKILEKNGGALLEDALISDVLRAIESVSELDGNIIRLSLAIDERVEKQERTHQFKPFWRLAYLPVSDIKLVLEKAYAALKKEKEVIPTESLVNMVRAALANKGRDLTPTTIACCFALDQRFKDVETGWGLMTWRHINPKSIRDKALIVMQKEQKPLHFVEIANLITEYGFDRKVVTVQAVHNELIRDENFVLIGRGLYALKDWGYSSGTVADIIEALLTKRSPLSKDEIISGVLQERQVKKGTISLNLQKTPWFTRVGRAMYALDLKKKEQALKAAPTKRFRRG